VLVGQAITDPPADVGAQLGEAQLEVAGRRRAPRNEREHEGEQRQQ
jgi:hypothetical protein